MSLDHIKKGVKDACLKWGGVKDNIEICLDLDDSTNKYRNRHTGEKLCRVCEVIVECGENLSIGNWVKATVYVMLADHYFRKLDTLGFFDRAKSEIEKQ